MEQRTVLMIRQHNGKQRCVTIPDLVKAWREAGGEDWPKFVAAAATYGVTKEELIKELSRQHNARPTWRSIRRWRR